MGYPRDSSYDCWYLYTCVLSDVALIARPLGAYIQGFIGEAYVCLVLYDCREYLCEV